MRVPHDIDPSDPAIRAALAGRLIATEAGLYPHPRDLDAAWGVAIGTTAAMHKRTTWRVSTVQRWARAVGLRLTFELEGITVPDDDDDLTALLLAAGDTSTPEREDHVHLLTVCNDLVRARLAAGWTAVAFAAELRLTENAVHWWQANPEGTTLIAMQRYARGMGGAVLPVLSQAPVHVVPRQREATV